MVLVGYTLAFGTNAVVSLGLSRQVAATTVTVTVVVAASLHGLYWFATRVIDW